MHTPYAPQNIIKAQDLYPTNGYHVHPHYPSHINPHMIHNGYSVPQAMYPAPSAVPTGQLIEIESAQSHNECEAHPQRSSSNKYHSPQEEPAARWHSVPETVKIPENPPVPSGKARDDGAGSWENWDYVYRNLETNKKDPRNDLASPTNPNNPDPEGDVVEKLKKTNLDRIETKQTDNTNKPRVEGDGEVRGKTAIETEVDNSKYLVVETIPIRTSPDKTKRRSSETSTSSLLNIKVNLDPESEKEIIPKPKEKTPEPKIKQVDDDDKWECITCTYLNPSKRDICEMCYKSKERGSELKPQPSGGQECPKCTLVNEPGLSYCAACSASLKDSPTYI